MATNSKRAASRAVILCTLALGAAALAASGPAIAAPAIPIGSRPYTISQPGSYVVTRDLICPAERSSSPRTMSTSTLAVEL